MSFTENWFSLAEPIFRKHLGHFVGQPNLKFLEIGSFEGLSAIWMLETILTGKDCKIICVDTFEGSKEHEEMGVRDDDLKERFMENMAKYRGRFQILEGHSQNLLRTTEFDNKIDFIYVDGSHMASDVLTDAVLSFYMLKPGGIMILDDYMWNANRYPIEETPKVAIDALISCFKGKITLLDVTWKAVVVRKL